MAGLSFHQVTKRYATGGGDVDAVRDFNLAVDEGELVVMVGPSGSGKSTVLRLAAGLEAPDAGTIVYDGREIQQLSPRDRDVSMVFQDLALYPHLNVAENLGFGLKMRGAGSGERAKAVTSMARLLDIGHLVDRFPASLSGGECQRVAIGRALVRRARLYLMDEPLSQLDAALRQRMRSELKLMHRERGTIMLYVTHDQWEAMALGDRIAVMRDGGVAQVGTPADVFVRPVDRFVASFIGSPPMNFVPARGVWREVPGSRGGSGNEGHTLPADAVTGFRPHEVRSVGEVAGDEPGVRVEGTLTLIEPAGDRVVMHMTSAEGDRVTALFPLFGDAGLPGGSVPGGCAAAVGERVSWFVPAGAMHWFEAGPYGRRIGP